MLDKIKNYFNLYSRDSGGLSKRIIVARVEATDKPMTGKPRPQTETSLRHVPVGADRVLEPLFPNHSPWAAIGQWFALFAGVTIQPFFQNYQTTHEWVWEGISGWTLFALITSFVIFPAVYKSAFDPGKPVMVQLAPIFTAGLGWHSLLATAIKALK